MTASHTRTAHATLVAEIATAAEGVAGVAFLRPGLADRLRAPAAWPAHRPAGVRVTLPADGGAWHVEIQVVVDGRARALDVARAVRADVQRHVAVLAPERPVPRVTVTVTGRV
ncbi:hypothetical protein ABZX85_30655 [Streptomyces sp. NPDC004539]|uniref:hypothetical protein n=1 Tax=Streptomyces sp. NPDC004539 TaxID=3154280 RepID=UPI0033BBB709